MASRKAFKSTDRVRSLPLPICNGFRVIRVANAGRNLRKTLQHRQMLAEAEAIQVAHCKTAHKAIFVANVIRIWFF